MYKLFVALRYLRANKIIYFSIAGVAVGIMVMIIVTSVMGGFSRDIQSRIRGLQSHLVVKPLYADRLIGDYEEIVRKIREIPHVTGASPRIEYAAWLSYRGSPRNVVVYGVDPKREGGTSDLPRFFTRGGKQNLDFIYDDGEVPEVPGIVSGSEIYAHEGSRVFLQTVRQGDGPMYMRGEFAVVGRFKSGMAEYDSEFLFMDLAAMQQFMKLAPPHQRVPVVNTIAIAVDDYDRNVQSVRMKVAEALHGRSGRCSGEEHASGYCGSFRIATWEEARSILLQAVAIERGIQVIILFCIVIVAGFNIIAIYTMMVRAKTRDVGILRSLGATRAGVTSIFLVSGGLCGLFGSLFGIILGALIATNLNEIVGFVRVSSRELNRAAWAGGAWDWSTIALAAGVFLQALLLLIMAWTQLYTPMTAREMPPVARRRGGMSSMRMLAVAMATLGLGQIIASLAAGRVAIPTALVVAVALFVADMIAIRLEASPRLRIAVGWIFTLCAGLSLSTALWLFFSWAPGYKPLLDDDPSLSPKLAWIVSAIAGALLIGWNVLRWLTDRVRETIVGGAIRVAGTVLYAAAAIACVAGLAVTSALLANQPDRRFRGWDLFPRDVYYLDSVPVLIDVRTIVAIVLATLFVSIVFSIYPAIRAASYDPIEAIRDE